MPQHRCCVRAHAAGMFWLWVAAGEDSIFSLCGCAFSLDTLASSRGLNDTSVSKCTRWAVCARDTLLMTSRWIHQFIPFQKYCLVMKDRMIVGFLWWRVSVNLFFSCSFSSVVSGAFLFCPLLQLNGNAPPFIRCCHTYRNTMLQGPMAAYSTLLAQTQVCIYVCVQPCVCALEVPVDQSVGDWIGLGETGKWAISRRGTRSFRTTKPLRTPTEDNTLTLTFTCTCWLQV